MPGLGLGSETPGRVLLGGVLAASGSKDVHDGRQTRHAAFFKPLRDRLGEGLQRLHDYGGAFGQRPLCQRA